MLKLDDQTLLHLRVKGIANELYLCSGRNVLWCAGDGGRGVCSSMCTVWCKSLSQPLKYSSLTPHEAPELTELQAESYVGVR